MITKDMTVGKPWKLILTFSLPLIAGNIFQELYSVVDTMIVGQFLGYKALAALGAGGWITWMLLSTVQGLCQGFSVPVTNAFGSKDFARLRRGVVNSAFLSVIISVLIAVLGQLILEPLLRLLDTPDSIFPMSLIYLRIYYAGCPAIALYNFAASNLRAVGNSRSPLIAMIIASFTNIGLDLLFVGPFKWGVVGAVVATVIAQLVAGIYTLICMSKYDFLKLTKDDLKISFAECKSLLLLGVPMALQNTIISVGGLAVQFITNQYGEIFIAGSTATGRLYGVIETAGISYGYALTTYVGQHKGAGLYKRIGKGIVAGHVVGYTTAITISLCMIFFGKNLLLMFLEGTPEEVAAALEVAYSYLFIMSSFLPILYTLHIFRSAVMGLGNGFFPLVAGFAELVMRVGASIIIPPIWGELNLFFAEPLAWAGNAIISIIGYVYCMNKLKKE